ncbi:C2H2 type zinc finger domain-containing protein 18 [Elsinoe australis]|uniref:C2H2 type zinc finger domain-containing protein 18 n=1 Tax=Elsinoe australis TaxID=40998 RepID=A0A4U7AJY5_9PEZI|nr:C2H2 type zinc finger domain-containing protein 18 [Elsinoe australis]
MSFECIPCAKLFRSMQALEGHRRDAPAHHRQHRCSHCKRSFGSSCAHAQHVRDTGHTTYEPERSTHAESSGDMPGQLSDTTKLLARVSLDHTLGGTTTTLCDRATIKTGKKQIAAALEAFKLRFAESDNKIEQWQSLCVYELGLVHINLVDLKLSAYTAQSGKYFPGSMAKSSKYLKCWLRELAA